MKENFLRYSSVFYLYHCFIRINFTRMHCGKFYLYFHLISECTDVNMQYYYDFINDYFYEYGYDDNSTSFENLLSYKYKCEFTDYDRFDESIEGLTGEVTVAAAATAFVVVVVVVVFSKCFWAGFYTFSILKKRVMLTEK